jgi:hypothetical protein
MEDDSTLYVGLDVHKDSITVAYAAGMGEVELFGKIRSTDTEVDRMSKRLQSNVKPRKLKCIGRDMIGHMVGFDDV